MLQKSFEFNFSTDKQYKQYMKNYEKNFTSHVEVKNSLIEEFFMVKCINWEIKLPSLSNKSPQEVLNIVNSFLNSNFEELDIWLNEQVENKNLKSFKREKLNYTKYDQKEVIPILDLKFNEKCFKKDKPIIYNEKNERWEELEFNGEVFLRDFIYTLKIPLDSPFNQESLKISVPDPWFVNINRTKVKPLKTQKNITISFVIGFRYDKEISNEELYPNFECNHDFKIFFQGSWQWYLIWECKKCGFICFCSCFKEAIEGCKEKKIITEHKRINEFGEEITTKTIQRVELNDQYILKQRGFNLKDLNLTIDTIPYYDNACEVCRGKPSTHIFCHKMYARSEFERKYGAYAKKKFFEYKLLKEDVNDEDLERRTNNLTREELGFKKIGEKFVSETELYRIIKAIFPNNKVIHHYKANWLGRQEIDIFIPSLNLAIEYDGIQHFKPIKAWGGEEGLKNNIKRDKIKEKKCKDNNITLIRFNYKENDLLSENYVKSKLKKYGINFYL